MVSVNFDETDEIVRGKVDWVSEFGAETFRLVSGRREIARDRARFMSALRGPEARLSLISVSSKREREHLLVRANELGRVGFGKTKFRQKPTRWRRASSETARRAILVYMSL